MEFAAQVIGGDRKKEACSNPIINWQLMVYFGNRCNGFVSRKKYDTMPKAFKALQRLEKKLCKYRGGE